MMKRPTRKELEGKLDGAKEAVLAGQIFLLDPRVVEADLLDLDFLIADLTVTLGLILNEVSSECYAGSQPPAKSYKASIKGCELFAFQWQSKTFGCAMYFKFTLKGGCLWIVSLHEDRPKRKG